MNNTLLDILLWCFVVGALLYPLVAMMAFLDLLGKATAKPKASPYVATPEEAAERKARSLEMFAQIEKSRLDHAQG